jgi:hypothetical protein
MTTALTIIDNPAPPNLPLGTYQYERQYQDQFANVLRLYFNRLQSSQQQTINQITALQAQSWLSNGGGMFSG